MTKGVKDGVVEEYLDFGARNGEGGVEKVCSFSSHYLD